MGPDKGPSRMRKASYYLNNWIDIGQAREPSLGLLSQRNFPTPSPSRARSLDETVSPGRGDPDDNCNREQTSPQGQALWVEPMGHG